jgi:hypothetical protein
MGAKLLAIPALLVASIAVGCLGSSGSGTFGFSLSDTADAIGDFSALNAHVSAIEITATNGTRMNETPTTTTFDLTRLTNTNQTQLFKGSVPAGSYKRVELVLASASGDLKSGGTTSVAAPSGGLFLNSNFTIASGKTTNFVFDIQVHKLGNAQYQFYPNGGIGGPSGPS